ncbi:dTMP kinase [Mucisphaera sp.]|uniref:dTMP kinase n=1 Tax=Mucisphaera sp. TaxID=2913024 RepID=UPI003D0BF11F
MPAHDHAWMQRLRSRFLVFDGPDGSGKSTQIKRLVTDAENAGLEVVTVREPGGTYVGEQVRAVLLDPANHDAIDLTAEMLLFMASRAQLLAEEVRPAIDRGALVIADRFISSTLAYQGTAGGLEPEDILAVGRVAVGQTWPDLVLVFDVDEQTAAKRMNPLVRQQEFDAAKDRIELRGAAFHRRVRQGYLDQADRDPDHYAVIDATPDPQTVSASMLETLAERSVDWSG